MAGHPGHPPQRVATALCRDAYVACPAYRYLRAAGKAVNPADFAAWVIRGVRPGRVEPASEPG